MSGNFFSPSLSLEVLDLSTGTWTLVPEDASSLSTFLQPRMYHDTALLDKGTLLVCGGFLDGVVTGECASYTPATNNWADFAPLPSARYSFTLTSIQE
jgi:hypothetical protein